MSLYASPVDEETASYEINSYSYVPPLYLYYGDSHRMNVTGKVTNIKGREFTLDMKNGKIKVDTTKMPYNPLDNLVYHQIKKGDRVSVTGKLDPDLFKKQEIKATSIITLLKDKKRRGI